MTKSFDDLVRLLDNATQYSPELDMETLGDPALCWRCDGAPGDGPDGLCGSCGDVLRSDKPAPSTIQEYVPVRDYVAVITAAVTYPALAEQLPPTAFLVDGPDDVVSHHVVTLEDGRWPDVLYRPPRTVTWAAMETLAEVWYLDEVVVAGHAAIYRRRPS